MRVLCTCLPWLGHFHPMVPLARALVGAGHEVAFATAAAFCPAIEQAGFTAYPAGMSLPAQLEEARRRFPEEAARFGQERFVQFVPRMLAGVAAPSRLSELVAVVDQWRPDVVVHDETELAGPFAAAGTAITSSSTSFGRSWTWYRVPTKDRGPRRRRPPPLARGRPGHYRAHPSHVCGDLPPPGRREQRVLAGASHPRPATPAS